MSKCGYGKLMPQYGFDIKKSLMEGRGCILVGTPKGTFHQ